MHNEEKSRAAAERVAKATFDQLVLEIDADLALIRQKMPKTNRDQETAMDMQYVKNRQRYFGVFGLKCLGDVFGSSYRKIF